VAEKFENYSQQALTLYTITEILTRPIVLTLLILSIIIIVYSIRKYKGISYN